MNLPALAPLMLFCAALTASGPEAAPAPHRPRVEAPPLPWVRNGVWAYSDIGRRLPPERLLSIAARNEAGKRWFQAFYFYRRVVVDYSTSELPWAFSQACLGMARCLNGAGRPVEAVEILLGGVPNKSVLRESAPARCLLAALLESAKVKEKKGLPERIRSALANAPASGPPQPPGIAARRHEEASTRGGSSSRPQALRMLRKAEFFLRRGERQAAVVYCDCVVENYPGTAEAREASRMLASIKGNADR